METGPRRYNWQHLTTLQVGKYAEYFVKMEFTMLGFDVYTSEVDDRGIDFVVRKDPNLYYDVQVKSSRGYNYIFFRKDKFDINRDNLYAAIVILIDGEEPHLYLVPAKAWEKPSKLLKDYEYEGKKSKPEWGLQLSKANIELLVPYGFSKVIKEL